MIHDTVYIVLLGINLFSFAVYGLDKLKAMKQKWRVSEKTLLILAFIAPFGAEFGRRVFRHKTRKPIFRILVPIFLIFQIAIFAYYGFL